MGVERAFALPATGPAYRCAMRFRHSSGSADVMHTRWMGRFGTTIAACAPRITAITSSLRWRLELETNGCRTVLLAGAFKVIREFLQSWRQCSRRSTGVFPEFLDTREQ